MVQWDLGSTHRNRNEDGRCNALLVFILCLIFAPTVYDVLLTDSDLWAVLFWWTSDVQSMGLAWLAVYACPYERLELKATLVVLLLWRVTVLLINAFALPAIWSPWALVAYGLALACGIWRMQALRRIKGAKADIPCAYYALKPIHSASGLFQAIFLPWHMGRYQSRVVFDREHCWFVHQGQFKRRKMSPDVAVRQGWVLIPLSRYLKPHERQQLDNLVGLQAVVPIADCRELMVAGRPESFI